MERASDPAHADDLHRYPRLFAEAYWWWGPIYAQFHRLDAHPPAEQVANVSVVPRVGERWAIISVDGKAWDLPGGTLEVGETVLAAARRELMEELGAELLDHQVVGAWNCRSLAEEPYRPHQPHPEFLRLVFIGEVRLVGPPTNPEGCEQVTAVDVVELDEAVRRFQACGRHELGELYTLAAEVHGSRRR